MARMPSNIETQVAFYLAGDMPKKWQTLHNRSGKRGGVLRVLLVTGESVIVKIWRLSNVWEKFKSDIRISNGWREWRMHRLIYKAGIPTPEPLWFDRITLESGEQCEVMGFEDLGDAKPGGEFIKNALHAGDEDGIEYVEDRIISISMALFRCRIFDVDNQVNNFLVDQKKRVVRIDFECARQRFFPLHSCKEYATILDRMLRSHLHAVHPEGVRTSRFMAKLTQKLSTPLKVLQQVTEITAIELEKENSRFFPYKISMPW